MKKLHYFFRALLYPVAAVVVPCHVMDKQKFRIYERGNIIISNHLGWAEIPSQIFWLPGYKRMISKMENGGGKFQTWLMKNIIGVILIDRDKPAISTMRYCIDALNNGETLSIFPEGTRNKVNRDIQPLHEGTAMFALQGNAFVTPVVIHHKSKLFERNYLGVGDPVDINDLRGKRADKAALAEATERFKKALEDTLSKLDYWVEHKGWKTDKKEKRHFKRELKKQYRIAKREAKKAIKQERREAKK